MKMIHHQEIGNADLLAKIKSKEIRFGGNKKLRIYGTLGCKSGKRLTRENRVFFESEEEAIGNGFRPCGHCMKNEYKKWKNGFIQ